MIKSKEEKMENLVKSKEEKLVYVLDNKMINASWFRMSVNHALNKTEEIIKKANESGIIKNAPITLWIHSAVEGLDNAEKVQAELEKMGAVDVDFDLDPTEDKIYDVTGYLELDLELNTIIEMEIDLSYLFYKHRGQYDRHFIDRYGEIINEQEH